MSKTATSKDVLNYYERNRGKIANCYDLDHKGLPVDPAWYRRRLYNLFLKEYKPKSVLDIGCGGGWTVLDALKKGISAIGVEPILIGFHVLPVKISPTIINYLVFDVGNLIAIPVFVSAEGIKHICKTSW